MDSLSLERSLVGIRICLVIGLRLRLRLRLRLTDWLAFVIRGHSSDSIGIPYQRFPPCGFGLGKVTWVQCGR